MSKTDIVFVFFITFFVCFMMHKEKKQHPYNYCIDKVIKNQRKDKKEIDYAKAKDVCFILATPEEKFILPSKSKLKISNVE